jgi:DNA topoisomerase I
MRFLPATYAAMTAQLQAAGWGGALTARVVGVGGKKVAVSADFDPLTGKLKDNKVGAVRWLDRAAAQEVAAALGQEGSTFVVKDVETKTITRKRPVPFVTSSLQQEANSRLGLTSSQAMRLAQELYEEGHISYMRTDSPNMSEEAVGVALTTARALFGEGEVDTQGKTKKNAASATAQEAHEAIRPAVVDGRFQDPKQLREGGMDPKKADLYELIYSRTLASVMKDAKLERKVSWGANGKQLYMILTYSSYFI